MRLRYSVFCALLVLTAWANAQTFTSIVEQPVPDDGSYQYLPIEVSGLPDQINSDLGLVQVCLNIDHTWNSDLEVKLISPDGTSILLFAGIGGDSDNFVNCCLRFDASEYVSNQWAPYTGTFLPMGNLAQANNGQNPNGTWNLLLHDTYAFADQGYTHDWSITFEPNAPEYEFPLQSTYLPIVKINTGGQAIPNEPKILASMQIINHGFGEINYLTDTDYEYEGDIMVELQGFTGPWYPKKNYDFDLVDENGIEIDTNLLGMPDENDWILKAEYLDPTLMFNNIAYSFGRKMDRYAPRLKYCELIIDGDYLGIYSLTEKVKRSNSRVDIAKLDADDIAGDSLTGGYIIEMNINGAPGNWNSQYLPINYASNGLPVEFKFVYPRAVNIQPEQAAYIQYYVDEFEDILHDPDFNDPETGYRSVIDVPSFIDFMLVNEMSTNYDSYGRSTFLYKEKINDGGLLHIGPPWDYDRGFWTIEGWVWEITHPGWPFPDWWSIMHTDTTFTHDVWCRWNELREGEWSDAAFIAHIDSLQSYLAEATGRNFQRWPELNVTNWNQQVQDLESRLLQRLAWMDANITGGGPCLASLVNNSPHIEEFEGPIFPPDCWQIADADNNGFSWNGLQPVAGYESEHCAFAYAIDPNGEDNYLITPQLTPQEGEHVSWYVSTSSDTDEHDYEVLISTTGTDPEDFTIMVSGESVSGSDWNYRIADLSNWWGQNIYIAFHHLSPGGEIMIKLDDVQYPTWTNEGEECFISVGEKSGDDFELYPNPTEDILFIDQAGTGKYRITDSSGRIVLEGKWNGLTKIDVSTISSGVYQIQLLSEKQSMTTQMVKR